MLKVGLTGGIASGKTTISGILREMNIPIIEADKISREVLNIYKEINERIKEHFGLEYFDPDGNLVRKKLGNYIFRHENERKKLEEIIMPFIKEEIFNQFREYDKQGKAICILDAATLIENNMQCDMDINILVWITKDLQIKRVMERDNLNKEEALNRINSQMPLEEKKRYTDYIIDNSGDIESTRDQIKNIVDILKNKCRRKYEK